MAKKYYAIAAGHSPGIYDNWPEAQAQVKGFSGAVYKGFKTYAEAKAWKENPSYSPSAKNKHKKTPTKKQAPQSVSETDITIYTDGGSINNPGPGGYGAVIIEDGLQRDLSGGFSLTTNNRMELMGCIVALRAIGETDKTVGLFSDSKYVVNGITKGWAKGWRKRGWVKSDKRPAVNPDLWGQLLDLVEGLDVTFNWVKGHAGNPLNERCDELAVSSARQDGLPIDAGYKP